MTRGDYERAVRALAGVADALRAEGVDEEIIARDLVDRRNQLKLAARADLPAVVLRRLEFRNLDRYGHPVGPTADALFARYGSWRGVADAAARPADLNRSPL